MRPIRLQNGVNCVSIYGQSDCTKVKLLRNTPTSSSNVDSLLHSIFAHRSASEKGLVSRASLPLNRVNDYSSKYPPGLKQNRLERAEIEALKLVNGALNSVNKCTCHEFSSNLDIN